MLGTIYNPLIQPQTSDFGKNTRLPREINSQFMTARGNLVNAQNFTLQYPPQVALPNTWTKSGESMNQMPVPLPAQMRGIKYPQYSTSSHALIEQPRVGVQIGSPDVYRDSPYQDWTTGIQYYTMWKGEENPKAKITPVIYPQAYRAETWAQPDVNFPQVNRQYTQDLTDLDIDFSCKSCDIASASLASPVYYAPRNPNAPLPVAAYPGEYPNIGYYTAKEIGTNTRDWPQPVNPILYKQRQKMGISNPPIAPDYSKEVLGQLRHGFDFS